MTARVGFGICIAGMILWILYVSPLAVQLMHYASYTHHTAPTSVKWTVLPIHDELFRPVAYFQYTVNGKTYEKKEIFQGGLYRTPFAAETASKAMSQPLVWYSPADPSQATVEKFFPLKKIMYSIVTLLLVIYSAYIAYYLTDKFYRKG